MEYLSDRFADQHRKVVQEATEPLRGLDEEELSRIGEIKVAIDEPLNRFQEGLAESQEGEENEPHEPPEGG